MTGPLHLSREEGQALLAGKQKRGNKYGAKRSTLDGEDFDSKAELKHFAKLKTRLKLGEIYALARQPAFPLISNGQLIGTYRADFAFWDVIEDRFRVIDVKGVVSRDFMRTQKLIKALYQIEVEIVK